MGRYGPMVQIGGVGDEEKPRFAKLQPGQSIETISYDEAMELFKLQGTFGQYEGKDVSTNVGKFGPYVKWGEEYISIPKGTDLSTVDLDKAIWLIEEKKQADAPIAMYEEKPVTKGKGRFGPYIKWDGMFINVPRRYNHDALSPADINELIDAKVKKEANRFIQRWPDEKISIENARWGPILKWGKKIIKLPRKADESKYTADELKDLPLEEAKKMIEIEVPGAFTKKEKKPAAKKKAAAKKAAPKKKK